MCDARFHRVRNGERAFESYSLNYVENVTYDVNRDHMYYCKKINYNHMNMLKFITNEIYNF